MASKKVMRMVFYIIGSMRIRKMSTNIFKLNNEDSKLNSDKNYDDLIKESMLNKFDNITFKHISR